MTNPKDIIQLLHFIRSGLASGLINKEEIVDWADKIITRDEKPDIFFIDLALSSSKSKNDILHHFNDFLNYENPEIQSRPLLGLLYKQYITKQINLSQTISRLFQLKFEAKFTEKEEGYIYSLHNDYDCAINDIYGTIFDVEVELHKFLSFYKNYSIDNFEEWKSLDLTVESEIDKDIERQQIEDK